MRAHVVVVAGPQPGLSVTIEPGESATVGRDAGCRLRIDHKAVSRQHLALEMRPEGLLVRDLGAKSATTLDGRAIPGAGVLVPLRGRIQIGKAIQLEVSRIASGPPGLRLEGKLGDGGAGEVFRAFQDPPGRAVAVKLLRLPEDERDQLEARVRREASLVARLDHPAIVRVHALLRHEGRFYLVRELVEGTALDRVLARGALPWREAAAIAEQVASALAHAHGKGVVHRDVKPGNVLVESEGGRARLLDFELARDARPNPTVTEGTRLTLSGDGMGTFCYMAPEQLDDAKNAGPPADVYGLAATLSHALAGRAPFEGLSGEEYLRAIRGPGPIPLETLAPEVPAPLRELVASALVRRPERRPSAAAFGAALAALRGGA